MSTLRCLIVFFTIMLGGLAGAGNVVFTDSPGWTVSNKRCTFLVGGILNQDPDTHLSGSLRLCLWVKTSPSANKGYRAAVHELVQLPGGHSYDHIQPSAAFSIPPLTGKYYLSVSLEEWNSDLGGWIRADTSRSALKTLKNGNFTAPKKWRAPSGKVISPRKAIYAGETLSHTLRGVAAAGGVSIPNGATAKVQIRIQENGTATVYGGSHPGGAPATYTYGTGKATYSGKSSPVARLTLWQGADTGRSRSDLSLFFQKTKKGFYKKVTSFEDYRSVGGTTWGIFTIY